MITVVLIVLAVLAYLGSSLVMLASVGGMALGLWFARHRSMRVQIVALLAGGVGASLAAEVVHLAHHIVIADEPDHGGFWISAFLVGLINVGAVLPFQGWLWFRSNRTRDNNVGTTEDV